MHCDAWRGSELDFIDRTASAIKVIQQAVGTHFQIDGAGQTRGKSRHGVAIGRVQLANPATAIFGEEVVADVFTGELADCWIVKSATGNRTTFAVRILIDWIAKIWIGRAAGAFATGPAVIRSRHA